MKFRIGGACASLILLAGCQGADTGSVAVSRNVAAPAINVAKVTPLSMSRKAGTVANMPDRGALVSYGNGGKPIKQEGAYTWYPVAISEAHAVKAIVTGEMTVPSPDGSQAKLRYERHEEHPDGNWTWVGRIEGGDPNQEAIFTFGEKAVFGSVPQQTGPALSIQTRNGVLWAVKTDPSKVLNPNTAPTDIMLPPAQALRDSAISQASQAIAASAQVTQSTVMVAAPPIPSNTIDVAVGYTTGLAASLGGASVAVTRINYLIQVGNQAFSNSQINGYLRLVRAVEVNYADNTKNSDALSQLTGSNGTTAVAVPASLNPLRNARNEYGADVAVLLRKFNTPENEGCGIAWLNGADQREINPAADTNFAYAVANDGTDQGTDGNSYYCAEETMVHEIGHLAGSAHDRDNSRKTDGTLQYGRYPYSFGMKTDSNNGNFYTVMSYGSTGQNSYRVFSNPNVTICGGRACGVTNQTDNARSLNQTIPLVASFRTTVVSFGRAPNDFNGDGRSEVYWRNSQTGFNHMWILEGRYQSAWYSVYRETDFNWNVIGTGDFNADGKADVIWRNSVTGRLFIQHMNGSTVLATSGPVDGLADLAWELVGLADFDGNGTTDIAWRNIHDGRITIWGMNGRASTSTTTVYQERVLSWRVIGTGDFNGDGYPDIFWRNASTGDNFVLLMQGASVLAGSGSVTRVPEQQWQIMAIRDFNGDGRDDVYWRNSATGQNALWLMNGIQITTNAHVYNEPNMSWKIVNSGDYNADGMADLFWRNMSTGQNYVQFYNGTQILPISGYTTQVADQAWQVTGR